MTLYKKFIQIITPQEHKKLPGLIVLMVIGMVLETAGMMFIAPIVALMTQRDLIHKYSVLQPYLNMMGNPTQTQIVAGGFVCLVGIFIIKSLFMGHMISRQNKFIFDLQANLSSRLYAGYLMQPWTFHLRRNSAQLILNATAEVNVLIESVLQPGLVLFTEGFVLLGVAAILFVIEPLGAVVVVSVFGLAMIISQRLVRMRALRWGEERQHHEGLRLQHLQQGLGGIKEIQLLGRESEFVAQFERHNKGYTHARQRQKSLLDLPRLWLELLAVLSLASLVWLMIAQNKPLDALLPILGLFVAAAFRLMPSIARMISAMHSIRAGLPVINTLCSEINTLNRVKKPASLAECLFKRDITLNHMDFSYEHAKANALNDINLTIFPGESVGFIGASGAGKSTLVDIILGLVPPKTGHVMVDGQDIQSRLRGWQNQIGYVPQMIYLIDDSLRRNVAFGLRDDMIDDASVDRAIKAAQLDDFVSGLPQGLNTLVGERGVRLSGGQRQRIGIARALYNDPPVLVLDEATSALDTNTEQGVMNAVNALQGKKTLIIIAHRLSTVAHCDRLYTMDQGRIISVGTFDNVVQKQSVTDEA